MGFLRRQILTRSGKSVVATKHFMFTEGSVVYLCAITYSMCTVCPFEGETSNGLHRQGKHYLSTKQWVSFFS